MAAIGVPSTSGIMSALNTYAVGTMGGVIYNLATGFVGSGLIGGAISAALAGSVVKGAKGDMIATVAGFAAGQSLDLAGMLGGGMNGGDDAPVI